MIQADGIVTELRRLRSAGQIEQGIATALAAPPDAMKHTAFIAELACLFRVGRRHAEAIALCSKFLDENPQSAAVLQELAYNKRAAGDWPGALDAFRALEQLEPGSARHLVSIGQCERVLKRHDDAISTFTRALAIEPANRTAHWESGWIYRAQNRRDTALAHLLEARKSGPQDSRLDRDIALEYAALQKYEDAEYYFNLSPAPPCPAGDRRHGARTENQDWNWALD